MRTLLLASLALLAGCGDGAIPGLSSSVPHAWPPQVGERYPDVVLQDLDGNEVALSSFEGRVLLVEPIGMT